MLSQCWDNAFCRLYFADIQTLLEETQTRVYQVIFPVCTHRSELHRWLNDLDSLQFSLFISNQD